MAVSLGGGALGVAPIIEFELGCTLRTEGGRVVIAARTSDEPGPFRVNDVIKSINGYSITSEDHAKASYKVPWGMFSPSNWCEAAVRLLPLCVSEEAPVQISSRPFAPQI